MQHHCHNCPGFREGYCGAGPEGPRRHGESAGGQVEGNWDWRAEIPVKEVILAIFGGKLMELGPRTTIVGTRANLILKGQSSKSVESTEYDE
jgi:hypothetical protein